MSNVDAAFIAKLWEAEDGEPESMTEVEAGDWEIEFKDYASRASVYRYDPTGQHFRVNESRSGSYYTDYDYDDPSFTEVEQKEVVKTVWVTKVPA